LYVKLLSVNHGYGSDKSWTVEIKESIKHVICITDN